MTRPALFVTNLVAPDRVGAFAALHARTPIELALFGGRSHHATGAVEDPGVPFRHVTQREVLALAASGRYGTVVCGTAGRTALPAAYAGARRANVPFVLWSALWAHMTTPAHLVARPLLDHIVRGADHVVTYGPHVSAFARARGARRTTVAPQAVDNAFWGAPATAVPTLPGVPDPQAAWVAMFAGRAVREKGLDGLLTAWRGSGLSSPSSALVLVGIGADDAIAVPGVHPVGRQDPAAVRNFLSVANVLVVPSIPTRSFREPWGLIANEAMNRSVPLITTDAVGAAAGGLVRHERNGLVVPAGDSGALAAALQRLHADRGLADRLGAAGARDVAAFTHDAWGTAFAGVLDDTRSYEKDC